MYAHPMSDLEAFPGSPLSMASPATMNSASMPGTPRDSDSIQSSTAVSPLAKTFSSSLRQREIEAEAPNALLYQKKLAPPIRRRQSSAQQGHQAACDSLNSILPWNTGNVPTRKISASSISGSPRPSLRHAISTQSMLTGCAVDHTPYEGLQRRPSQLSVRMRRESMAEKAASHESLVSSPVVSPKASPVDSRSRWSPDESDAEEADRHGPCLPSTECFTLPPALSLEQSAIDEEDDGSIRTARRVSRSANDSVMLPIFLRASKLSREEATRRGSQFSLVSAQSSAGTSDKGDLVRLITALQSTHLDETRRLNEMIAALSTKVATLERDLAYMSTPSVPLSQVSGLGVTNYSTFHSPKPVDVRWRPPHYRYDQEESCGRRLSAMSSSPRTAAMTYI